MKKFKLTKLGKYLVCFSAFAVLIGTLVIVDISLSGTEEEDEIKVDHEYVGDLIIDSPMPVVSSTSTIIRPYLNPEVKILKNYYDHQDEESEQVNSLLYYESTYMPNYAVAYGGIENFEVISILDGTVISIKEDSVLGSIIEIQHENNLISVYQSVSNITVKENQVVHQGEVIASSGISNLNKDLNKHLLFELLHNGQIVDPEEYYNKDIKNL